MTQKVKVGWYCALMTGPMAWHGDYWEPDDCGTSFETIESLDDWRHGYCTARCPRCKSELNQNYDSPEIIDEIEAEDNQD